MSIPERLPITVLLSAYGCHPAEGSEPGVGWAFLRASLQICDRVHVVTRKNNVPGILTGLNEEERERCAVVGFDLPEWLIRAKRAVPGGTQLYYLVWQLRGRAFMADLHRIHKYDLAHHVTFAVDWGPIALNRIDGLGYVWGPVGGSTNTPVRFWKYLGPRGAVGEVLRRAVGSVGRLLWANRIARDASLVVAANRDVAERFKSRSQQLVVEPNPAIEDVNGGAFHRSSSGRSCEGVGPRVAVGVGRLLPWKGWALALEALAKTTEEDLRLVLIGEGPDRARLAKLANKYDLSARVTFLGQVDRREVLRQVAGADVFLFPSFHDTCPWSVGEALALERKVVCLDLGGPQDLVRRAGGADGVVDHRDPDVAGSIARALTEPSESVDRLTWSWERLPMIVHEWYSQSRASC